MLHFVRREITNVYVYKDKGNVMRVEETLQFNFGEKEYRLKDFKLSEIKKLNGGEENE